MSFPFGNWNTLLFARWRHGGAPESDFFALTTPRSRSVLGRSAAQLTVIPRTARAPSRTAKPCWCSDLVRRTDRRFGDEKRTRPGPSAIARARPKTVTRVLEEGGAGVRGLALILHVRRAGRGEGGFVSEPFGLGPVLRRPRASQ